MIDVQNLSFLKILDSIHFQIPEKSSLAVIGHNGAGKTTLFHLLLGLKFPSRGSFKLGSRSFGYVPERPYLEMEENLLQFLTMHLNLIGYAKENQKDEIKRVAELVGLQGDLMKKFKNYSKGMLQKALLAQSMLGFPSLIFLDEPMSGLDPDSRKEMMIHLQELRKQGVTLVFSSHVMEDVSSLADAILVLDHGKQKFFGSVQEWRAKC
jgi:ABC-type multidrug transport system ATPase subunit